MPCSEKSCSKVEAVSLVKPPTNNNNNNNDLRDKLTTNSNSLREKHATNSNNLGDKHTTNSNNLRDKHTTLILTKPSVKKSQHFDENLNLK